MPNKQDAVKAVALTAAGLALLTACGEPKATPMNDCLLYTFPSPRDRG